MPDFSSDKAALSFSFIHDLPERNKAGGNTRRTLTITGNPDPGGPITATVVGGETWISIDGTVAHGVAANVRLLPENLPRRKHRQPLRRTATIRFSAATYDDLDVPVTIDVKPGGPPA